MRTLCIVVIAALLGSMSGSAVAVRPPAPISSPKSPEAIRLQEIGRAHFAAARYPEAEQAFSRAYLAATRDGDLRTGLSSLATVGNCELARLAYQRAMTTYLEAKQLAERIGDKSTLLAIQANIALIYAMMGDYQKTIVEGEQLLARFEAEPNPSQYYVKLYVANAENRLKHFERAGNYFRQSATEAGRAGNTRLQAMALDHFGLALLDQGKPGSAEPLLKQALGLREKSVPDEVAFSHRSLGVLYSRMNRPADALPYLDQAIASLKAKPRNSPIYEVYGERAAVFAALGDSDRALSDYRTAFDYTRRWRLEVLPAGLLPAHWEGSLRRLRSSFIRYAAERAIEHQKPELALEALVLAEESRLASLRASYSGTSRTLPPEYHQALRQMQEAEAALLADSSAAAALRNRVQRLQAELLEIEARTRLPGRLPVLSPDTLALARAAIRRLRPDEAMFSFYVDEPASFVWEITRDQVRVHRLAGRDQLAEAVERFRRALLASDDQHLSVGRELYSRLFGQVSRNVSKKPFWTVVLDDRLFELPFGGLLVSSANRPDEYLIEHHTLRTAPSLFLASEEGPRGGTEFLGVGDPIYNLADSRAVAGRELPARTFQLPRLLGSAAEVDRCARLWEKAAVLKGRDVTTEKLAAALRSPVRILHFATHFVRSKQDSNRTMIALGFGGGGKKQELLGDEQIAAMETNADLVVLSGCQSGAGQTISGAGLLGLTRSWLLSGANSVAASHWPTPDDTGEIFLHFYRYYAQALADHHPYGSAQAMRKAQLDMRRSSGWRSAPRYWAAFFLMSKG